MENKGPATPLIDDPRAPEIFATNASGFLNNDGSVVITLEARKSDYSGDTPKASRYVVGRLIMPARSAHALAIGLFDYLKAIGVDPSAGSPGGAQ